jgi:Protein of unknown function (DUF3987)/DnaB-like helicase N terminal domain
VTAAVASAALMTEPQSVGRTPPHNIEAEKSVLGAIFIKAAAFDEVRANLEVDDFFLPVHREIFDAMLTIDDRDQALDYVAVADELKTRSQLGRLEGGESYLTALANTCPTAENALHYARLVRQKARQRHLIGACADVQASAYGDIGDAVEFFAVARAKIERATTLGGAGGWLEPEPLPDGLPSVPAFHAALLPTSLRAWSMDIAERLQCPPDFPAAAAMVALAAVVGRRYAIRPRRNADWTVVSNLFGALVSRPGMLKSPALEEATAPIRRLSADAVRQHEVALRDYEWAQKVRDAKKKVALGRLAKATPGELEDLRQEIEACEVAPPVARRYIVNDSTSEKLGIILSENPQGVLYLRDELTGWLASFERDGHESDRAFILELWSGSGAFTYDRVGRGTLHISACCASVLGTIQPGPLGAYLRAAVRGGAGADGLLQRFQMVVWPDQTEWKNVDKAPDREAREHAHAVFDRLDRLDPADVERGADGLPYLRFGEEAQELFNDWLAGLQGRLMKSEHEALEAHLAKYRSLMPSLALLSHLADSPGRPGPVSLEAAKRAAAWCEYLEAHARRLYSSVLRADVIGARTLLEKLRAGEVAPLPFTARDVYKREWAGLSGKPEAEAAIAMLADHRFVRAVDDGSGGAGGRPTLKYQPHPGLKRGAP